MNKIIFIIDSLEPGGSERILSELSNYLSSKYKISIITLNQKKNIRDFYPLRKNIKRIKIYQNIKQGNTIIKLIKIYKSLALLKKYIKIEKPLVTISFLTFSNLLNIASSLFAENKCIISERGDPKHIKRSYIYGFFSFFLYRFSYKLVVQSDEIMNRFKFYGVKRIKIYNHVRDIKKKGNVKKLSFINISRLDIQKNILFLIKVFENLIKINKNFNLKIIGTGNQEIMLKNYIKNKNLSRNIQLLGMEKDVDKYLLKSDYYIHTSNAEGMSNSIIEAMSARLKCIIKKPKTSHEFFKDKKNCFIIKENNEKKFSREIVKITKLKKKFTQKITHNAKLSSKKLNIQIISNSWEKII